MIPWSKGTAWSVRIHGNTMTHAASSSPTSSKEKSARAAHFRAELVKFVPELRGRALRLTRVQAAADDLVQDCVERALKFESAYENGTNLRAWLHQVLFSIFVSRYRRARRERKVIEQLTADPAAWTKRSPFRAPDADGPLTETTERKLQQLPEGFQSVIRKVDLEERSYRDAAIELELPLGTVMSRLHRGRKLLGELFALDAA